MATAFRIRAPLRMARLQGTLSVTGDIEFSLGRWDIAQTGEIGLNGAMGVTGDLQFPTGGVTSFPLEATAPIGLAGAMGVTGDIDLTHPINVVRTAGPSISGQLGMTGDIGFTLNQAPVWGSAAGTVFNIPRGGTLDLTNALRFTDPNSDVMTFSLISGSLPSGVSLNSNGILSATTGATLGQSGDLVVRANDNFVTPVPFNVVRTAGPSVSGAMQVIGDVQSVLPVPFNVVRTAGPNLAGAVGVTGNVQFTTASSDVVTLGLLSPINFSNTPWTFGQPFKEGDVPSSVTATGEQIQFVPKNFWPDGSVQWAIISGRKSLVGNVVSTITLKLGTNTGVAIALAALQAQIADNANTVDFGAFGICDLHDAISATSTYTPGNTGNKKWSAGLIRQEISGAQMSEWHFYTPAPSDDHLAVFWEVRCYAGTGEIEVEVVVDNGWLNVASPGTRTYTAVVKINNTTRDTISSLPHGHHTRWSRNYWFNTGMPEVVPLHNSKYLRETRMVPNYGYTNPSSLAWLNDPTSDGWDLMITTTRPAPFSLGNASPAMGDYGYHESIGLLPRWEALYCTAGDTAEGSQAYVATVGNARNYGRYALIYRDETTLRPMRFSSYPDLAVNVNNSGFKYGSGSSATNTYTPLPANSALIVFTSSHHHNPGHLAYLLTGKHHFLEQLQFCASANYLATTTDTTHRNHAAGVLVHQARMGAWGNRTLGCAAAMTPSVGLAADTVLKTELNTSLGANATNFYDRYVDPSGVSHNTIGVIWRSDTGNQINGGLGMSYWEMDFFLASLGWAEEMKPGGYTAGTVQTKLSGFKSWIAEGNVARLGTTEFNFAHAAQYIFRIAPGLTVPPLYSTWTEIFDGSFGAGHEHALYSPIVTSSADIALIASELDSGYWGNMLPALAYAVDHGQAGIVAGRERLLTAKNWHDVAIADLHDNPIWGVVPRTYKQYSTSFPYDQNPLVENSASWHSSAAAWKKVQIVSGRAHANGFTENFDDAYAILSGFGPNVEAEATIYKGSSVLYEVELLFRVVDTGSTVRGYECLYNVGGGGIDVVRWNGPLGNFTSLNATFFASSPTMVTGDRVRARMSGNIIQMWYVPLATGIPQLLIQCDVTQTPGSVWTDGNPGISFYVHSPVSLTSAGFSNYSVREV